MGANHSLKDLEKKSQIIDFDSGDEVLRRPAFLRASIVIWLICLDVIGLSIGFGSAIGIRQWLLGDTLWHYTLSLIPIYIISAFNVGAYTIKSFDTPLSIARRGFSALSLALIATIFFGFILNASIYLPRFVVGAGFIISAAIICSARSFFSRNLEAIVGGNPFRVILISEFEQSSTKGEYSLVVSADEFFEPSAQDPIMYDRLARLAQNADRVVVACRSDRRDAWAHALKGAGVQGEVIIPELATLAPLGVTNFGDNYAVVVATGPLSLPHRAVKRAFDIFFATSSILVLSPFFILMALIIKIDSPGSAFFLQDRIGRGNKIFKIVKFRSMRTERADLAGYKSTARGDDRVTRVGRFMRRTSIDELPQLFNVFIGNMSIVGPRPHALGSRVSDKLFWEIDARYWHRHAAKPGLTGLAQIRGFRGATLIEEDLKNRLQADLEYFEHWSIWRDIKIILQTIPVLFHKNAF